MASAIMEGLVANNVVSGPDKIICADPYTPTVDRMKTKGYQASPDNTDVCKADPEVIIICVKPNLVETVCMDIVQYSASTTLIVSVAAGITLDTLQNVLPGRRVIRVMPNTACLVGESASGFSLGSMATTADRQLVTTIFGSVGIALEQKEVLLNAVTGLSGSGPAYVFQFIEALSDGRCNHR